jgi:hypothetical protein
MPTLVVPVAPEALDAGAVARRAYELFLERGGLHGYDVEDWLQAERELEGLLTSAA